MSSYPSKTDLEQLYLSGLSMSDISLKLNCSVHKITYWMQKYQIARRSRSDAAYVQANPTGDPFKIKNILTKDENRLYGLGIGIYWGEGEKTSNSMVRVGNTDLNLILTFRKFLLTVCQVHPEKIHYSIICFNDSVIADVGNYWSRILETPLEKFGKIVQIPPQGKGLYQKKSLYGVCTICVCNTKLKNWIMKEIEKLHA